MTESTDGCTPWYAIQVKTTHERRVAALLDYKGFEQFLPLYRARRRWSDRVKEVDLPLFPGYVFCRFAPESRAAVLKTPSVLRVAGIGRRGVPVDECEIRAIQRAIASGLSPSPHPYIQAGQQVCIRGGALDGLEGRVLSVRQRHRLILSITLLQRSVAVEVDSAWVALVHPPAPAGRRLCASA